MKKKLYILQIFSNFVIEIKKQLHQSDMDNFGGSGKCPWEGLTVS